MKRTLNQTQLENMITECVGQVLAESRQQYYTAKKPNRKVMNESQMQAYIRNIINEEMEDEAFWSGLRAMGGKMLGDAGSAVQGAAKSVGRTIGNAARNAGKAVGNFASSAGQAAKNGYNNVAQYGRDVMQTGKNASASADVQKLVQSIDGIYQKYGRTLTKSQQSSIRSAKSALTQLAAAFGNGVNV